MMTYDVHALREREFPWAARGERIYFDHASTGPLPQRAVDAQTEANAYRAQPWTIGFEYFWDAIVQSRALSAQLIGASADEMVLTTNTSYGVNLAARALPLHAGDVVVSTHGEFPANVYPWMALEKAKGVHFHMVPTVDQLPDEDAIVAALDRPGVKALTVSWVSFATGAKLDLVRLGRECKARNLYFVVDAIQGLGAAALDVKAAQIDILASGAQKWLISPWGTAFAYVRRELIPHLEPPVVGWLGVPSTADFTRFLDYDLSYYPDARKFEVFTSPMHDLKAMAASLSLFLELGPAAVEAHVRSLADHIIAWSDAHPHARLITPRDPARRAGVVSVAVPDLADASKRLEASGVSHSVREGGIRLSPHLYNTIAEVDAALKVLEG